MNSSQLGWKDDSLPLFPLAHHSLTSHRSTQLLLYLPNRVVLPWFTLTLLFGGSHLGHGRVFCFGTRGFPRWVGGDMRSDCFL